MDKIVGVAFGFLATVVHFLAGSAVGAFAVLPGVLHAFVAYVALLVIKSFANRVFAIGGFAAIHASAAK